MKKISIFIAIIVILIGLVSYKYLSYKMNYNIAKKYNLNFSSYLNTEIDGSELATIINRAVDDNRRNNIQVDKHGKYVDDHNKSINIEIKMTDIDKTYSMEKIVSNGMEKFIKYYNKIKFKCTKIEYHNSTKKVKYMLFEQITE